LCGFTGLGESIIYASPFHESPDVNWKLFFFGFLLRCPLPLLKIQKASTGLVSV